MLKLFTTFALRLGGHDEMHCHCRRHYLPSPEIRRNRAIRQCLLVVGFAAGLGWLFYHIAIWACSIPGTMRIR